MSVTLTLTAMGRVTLPKEFLEHMGVRPGDRLEADLLPAGCVQLWAKPKRPVLSIFGLIKKPDGVSALIEDINEAIAAVDRGWPPKG